MTRILLIAGALCLCTTILHAQIIQPVNRYTTIGESEATVGAAVAGGQQSAGAQVLPQGNVDASPDGTKVGIQAADLWFNRYFRFYGRLTLPVTDSTTSSNSSSSTPSPTTTTSSISKLSATARQQLTDPYGGLLNLSGGLFIRLNPSPTHEAHVARNKAGLFRTVLKGLAFTPDEKLSTELLTHTQLMVAAGVEQLQDAKATVAVTDVRAATMQLQDPHGLFLDWRVGLKFIDLPHSGESNANVSGTTVSVFYTSAIGLKLIAPLYNVEPTGNTTTDALHLTGGLTLGGYAVVNYAADRTQSDLFTAALKPTTWGATGVLGWDLPSTDVASLTFSFTPWTNNSQSARPLCLA